MCTRYLSEISDLFLPGRKVTLIVRNPEASEEDFVMTDDTLDGAIEALERSKERSDGQPG